MKRAAAVVFVLLLASTTTGCMTHSPFCTRSWMLAHPTMTLDELAPGQDTHVRAESEGAKGSVGSNQPRIY